MINHISIGVSDLARSKAFYDAVLAPLDYRCLSNGAEALGYGAGSAVLWLLAVTRPVKPGSNSGLHICFDAPNRNSVEAFHAKAIEHGARDNGKPGPRADYGPDYFAAFVIDPDGYRLEAYCSSKS